MRHNYFGRKLKRNVGERRGLFMMLVRSLVEHGTIRTSIAKAKAVQPLVEKLITKAKKATHADVNEIRKTVADKKTEDKIVSWGKTRFARRTSGFTRIVRVGNRLGDASREVLLSFVDTLPEEHEVIKPKKTEKVTDKKVEEAQIVKTAKSPRKPRSLK
jgi:large subunit ribosomal protein L17